MHKCWNTALIANEGAVELGHGYASRGHEEIHLSFHHSTQLIPSIITTEITLRLVHGSCGSLTKVLIKQLVNVNILGNTIILYSSYLLIFCAVRHTLPTSILRLFCVCINYIATPYEVIDHFTDFLLVSLNNKSLLPLMYSYGLLDDQDLELIATGPTSYHRNSLILSYVQHMDTTGLSVFRKVLQETHPRINLPLLEGMQDNFFVSLITNVCVCTYIPI